VCVSIPHDIIGVQREVNDIEIAHFLAKHRVNKQVVSRQSSVMEHEVFSSVPQIELLTTVSCFTRENIDEKIELFIESAQKNMKLDRFLVVTTVYKRIVARTDSNTQ
jgi:hypothetical protein